MSSISQLPIAPLPLSNSKSRLQYSQTYLFELCPDLMEMVYEQTIRCRMNKVMIDINYKTWSPSFKKTYRRMLNEVKKSQTFNGKVNPNRQRFSRLYIHFARVWIRLIRPDIEGFNFSMISSLQKPINLYGIYLYQYKGYNGRIVNTIRDRVVEIDKACKENKLVGYRKTWLKSIKIRFMCNYKE